MNVNAHIHTPYSFSSFDSISQAVHLAREEKIAVLGINDFNTAEGYAEFASACEECGIYPLFNIEFITLIETDRRCGLCWNDPLNPGMMHLSGKGLNHPLFLSSDCSNLLASIWKSTQDRIWRMLGVLNDHMFERQIDLKLDYHQIRNLYAKNSVRERHVAKALYLGFVHKWADHSKLDDAFKMLFDDSEFSADYSDAIFMQTEIRNRLLKKGKPAFVDENYSAFLRCHDAKNLILKAGGIPSYPVLVNDPHSFTQYEKNVETLAQNLIELKIFSVEFLSFRTPFDILKMYARYFYEKGFCVTFGTEHNTPERLVMIPTAKGGRPLDGELEMIGYEGACIIAAHQEKHRQNKPGFVDEKGMKTVSGNQLKEFVRFGDESIKKVIVMS